MKLVAGILIISFPCAILLVVIIEIYYKLRKENQISSPFIHINSILLSVVIGICGIILVYRKVSKSPDPAAMLAPFLLAPPILAGCAIAGILVGLFYRVRNYKLLFGKEKIMKDVRR